MLEIGEVATAMVTPFNKDYSINYEVCYELMEFLIKNGSDSILISGTTGESPVLSDEEKIELFKFAKDNFGDKAKIIAGTGSNDTKHSIELSKEAEKIGVDSLLIVAPYYNRPDQSGLYKHFEAIAAETETPIILYNVPSRTASNISSETCIELSRIDNICAVKEASGNMKQIAEIIRGTEKDFKVLSGNDGDTFHIISMGGHGVISVASHLIGNTIKQMIGLIKDNRLEEASKIHLASLDIFYGIFMATNPVPIKYAMNLKGINVGPARLPLSEMGSNKKENFKALLNKAGLL